MTGTELLALAEEAMTHAYAPYSHCMVGAALLCASGSVYTGCNIENAGYSATNCAERTAFFKAVSEGERTFSAIAVVGGKDGKIDGIFAPCGVCRQVMREFCEPESFLVLLGHRGTDGNLTYDEYTLAELLPLGFGPADVLGGETHF